MEENKITNEETTENTAKVSGTVSDGPVHEPKQNYVIYTVLSVLLFAALYLCWRLVVPKLFRDYSMSVDGGSFTAEQLEAVKKYTEINCDNISEAVYQRTNGKAAVVIYYEKIGDEQDFAENRIDFEYGDPEEDVRSEIYPYGNSVPEYVYGKRYINIGDPDISCLVYEYNGDFFAEYRSSDVSAEITSLFADAEKVYSE